MPECNSTLTGKHMFNPKKIGTNWAKAASGDVRLMSELQCWCGALPPSEAEVKAQLAATQEERKRQVEAARSLTGRKRMEANGTPYLPGFGPPNQ